MKFSLILAVGAATAVSAQMSYKGMTLDELLLQIPTCAIGCLEKIVPTICPKGLADFECECQNQQKLQIKSSPCILNNCKGNDVNNALFVTSAICKEFKKNGYSGDPTKGTITKYLTEIPLCAIDCFKDKVPQVCPKGAADFACQCTTEHVSQLTGILTPCVQGVCSNAEALASKRKALEVCAAYNQATGGGSSGSGGTGSGPIITPTVPTGFTGPGSDNKAPMATAGPIGAAIAAALAFAL